MSEFFIALVAETKPIGSTDKKEGECRQVCSPGEFTIVLQEAIEKSWSIELFFSVYAMKHDGTSTCVEDFRTLGEALTDWPDADISRVIFAAGKDPNTFKIGSKVA